MANRRQIQQDKKAKKQHTLFMRRTHSVYRGMVLRRRKHDPGAELDFGVDLIRDRVTRSIGSACSYCSEPITVKNFSLDHALPIERGGSWSVANLNVVCKSCNCAKGRLTADEFRQLMDLLDTFGDSIRKEVIGRLKAGASVVRLQFLRR